MRRIVLISLSLGVVTILANAAGSLATAASSGKEMAVVDIPDKTKLLKATLQGKYIFVHDNEMMKQGAACLYVYEYGEDVTGKPELKSDKLVLSFHCEPVQREKATNIILTYGMTTAGWFELREIQFAGSTEGHRVP